MGRWLQDQASVKNAWVEEGSKNMEEDRAKFIKKEEKNKEEEKNKKEEKSKEVGFRLN